MLQEFGSQSRVGQLYERHLQSGLAGLFHGRNAIGVLDYEYEALDGPDRRIERYVEPNSHINALLLKDGFEVLISYRAWADGYALRTEAPKFQDSLSHCEQFLARQFAQPVVSSGELLHGS